MTAQLDVGLAEDLDLPDACARQKREPCVHGLRLTRYSAAAAASAASVSATRRQRARAVGSGGRLPLYTGTGSVLVSVSMRGYTCCPTSALASAARSPSPSNRARIPVTMSGPPRSLARAISRSPP